MVTVMGLGDSRDQTGIVRGLVIATSVIITSSIFSTTILQPSYNVLCSNKTMPQCQGGRRGYTIWFDVWSMQIYIWAEPCMYNTYRMQIIRLTYVHTYVAVDNHVILFEARSS